MFFGFILPIIMHLYRFLVGVFWGASLKSQYQVPFFFFYNFKNIYISLETFQDVLSLFGVNGSLVKSRSLETTTLTPPRPPSITTTA